MPELATEELAFQMQWPISGKGPVSLRLRGLEVQVGRAVQRAWYVYTESVCH